LIGVRQAMDSMFYADTALAGMVEPFGLDGVVFHSVKSCRTVSTGLADARRAFSERHNIQSLFLESDMMDRRVVSEAQMKNRVDAFFEGLASQRPQSVGNR
jgi:benzoyl-CoA reductase subunit B